MNDISNGDVIEKSKAWTKFERQIRLFRDVQCKNEGSLKFYAGVKQAMRDSTLSSFLYHLNSVQRQARYVQRDKLDRIRFDIDKKLENLEKLRMRNNICDDLLGFIEYLLEDNPTGKITVKSCLKKLDFLRLTGSKVHRLLKKRQVQLGLQSRTSNKVSR
uniref:Uncharacterized protein n=1 Tax=Homalodisca liturata TaxID=320908 RepID=A0A1B6IA60_9HEMI